MTTPKSAGKQRKAVPRKSDVEWLGESTIEDGKQHYLKCSIRGITINVNDYVMVNTQKDSIGQVLDLHYLGSYPDPYRAKIRWFYRYPDLTATCKKLNELTDRPNELFIPAHDPENKPFNGSIEVIDAETIIDVCKVEILQKDQKFPRKNIERFFHVQYAFDANDVIYSAKEYLKKWMSASQSYITETENKKCRTPRLSEKQWRIGTPKTANQSESPFSLKPLRITLKSVQQMNNATPLKRKASRSIPDVEEVTNKKSKVKTDKKSRRNGSQQTVQSPKVLLSPLNKYRTEEVLNIILSGDDDQQDDDDDDDDESDDESLKDNKDEVFFTEKSPVKKPVNRRETRSKTTATPTPKRTSQHNKENKKSATSLSSKYQTPKGRSRSTSTTGKPTQQKSSRKVSIKTPSRKPSSNVETDILTGNVTPKKTPGRVGMGGRKSIALSMTPSMPCRTEPCKTPRTPLQEARSRLHVSAVPPSLPCREDEFADILSFIEGKLMDGTGGCMYISGVPGTGKTATVHEAIRVLQHCQDEGIPHFKFIEINGMKLTEPNQAYSMLLKQLTGQKATPAHASDLLEKLFTEQKNSKESLVLMVDELDLLWTRKQGVMYNLFEWPSRRHSKLVVLAIANTMDLPERMMINRVQSRLGLTRLTFQPYNFNQLQEIVLSRIQSLNVFDPDAMQLVARKVAAVSGDARRCLDICRRAVEVAELSDSKSKAKKGKLVGMDEVNVALQDMFSSPKIKLMMNLSSYEVFVMKAVLADFRRTGVEETTFGDVFDEMCNLCRLEGVNIPSMTEVSSIVSRVGASRLLLVETGRLDLQRRISLNVNQDDVIYALRNHSMK